MKRKLLTIYITAGFILIAMANLATADDVILPPWADQDRTVFAEWDTWTGYPGPITPDDWSSNPPGLQAPYAYAGLNGDPCLLSDYQGRYDVIQLNGDSELSFSIPNFSDSNDNSYKDIWIQVTYYRADVNQYHPRFTVFGSFVGQSDPCFIDSVDWQDGWVTEAWNLQIWPNPSTESVWLQFSDPFGSSYPTYVDQVVIDTMCVPEPTTICLLGLGGLLFRRSARKFRKR